MKKFIFRTALVGSLALFASCGGSASNTDDSDSSSSYASEYPSAVESNYVESCTSNGGDYDACQCTFDYIASEISYERFTEIEMELGDGADVDDYSVFTDAAESCV